MQQSLWRKQCTTRTRVQYFWVKKYLWQAFIWEWVIRELFCRSQWSCFITDMGLLEVFSRLDKLAKHEQKLTQADSYRLSYYSPCSLCPEFRATDDGDIVWHDILHSNRNTYSFRYHCNRFSNLHTRRFSIYVSNGLILLGASSNVFIIIPMGILFSILKKFLRFLSFSPLDNQGLITRTSQLGACHIPKPTD